MSHTIVITMAGRGSRFREAGYAQPKYEILAHGRSLFDWSMLSLNNFLTPGSRVVFICLTENNSRNYVLQRCQALGIADAHVLEVQQVTDGQATSAYLARDVWYDDQPLLIYNIDTYVQPEALCPADIRKTADGWVPCFRVPGDHWSFVRLGEDGWAQDLAEKSRISDFASIGLYWFASARRYTQAYEEFFADPANLVRGERYVAPLYRQLIADGGRVCISDLNPADVHVLGTPTELEQFLGREATDVEVRQTKVRR